MKNSSYLVYICLLLAGCHSEQSGNNNKKRPSTMVIINTKTFFGHQSVGNNIINGIQTNKLVDPKQYPIVQFNDFSLIDTAQKSFLLHKNIGTNYNPISKCDDFSATLHSGIGNKVNNAGMKFCYVDFDKNTDIEALITYYRETINKIKVDFPQLKIFHITAPLTNNDGFVNFVKNFLKGNPNLKRSKFNELLKSAFPNDPVFDLAALESTTPEGKHMQYTSHKQVYYSLFSGYTEDGGHLNTVGAEAVALKFCDFLSHL